MSDVGNPWDAIREALRSQRLLDIAVGGSANSMAELLVGHLSRVDASNLRALKMELRRFNMTTGRWRRPK